jgi:dTDP-4-amino-4,6-dideoxygalactose transaminase
MGVIRGNGENGDCEELKSIWKRHCFLVSWKGCSFLILETRATSRPDKVLSPAFTCYSGPSAVARAGLKVTLCDVVDGSFDFDFQQLRPLLADERLICIISSHLYGVPADIERLREVLGPSPIAVVEDAAQAMGGTWQGQKLGSFGDASFFSLGRGKAFSTVEGGIILTDRDDLAEVIARRYERLPAYGLGEVSLLLLYALALRVLMHPLLFWLPQGLPFLRLGGTIYDPEFKIRKMSSLQGGMTRGWTDGLAEFKERRRVNAECWQRLEAAGGFRFCFPKKGEHLDLLFFPLEVFDRALRGGCSW